MSKQHETTPWKVRTFKSLKVEPVGGGNETEWTSTLIKTQSDGEGVKLAIIDCDDCHDFDTFLKKRKA